MFSGGDKLTVISYWKKQELSALEAVHQEPQESEQSTWQL